MRERFRCKLNGRIAAVTPAKGGGYQLTPPCFEAWQKFQAQHAREPILVARPSARKAKRFKQLSERDGVNCFYCGGTLDVMSATIEHVLARAHGGSDRIENLVLACEPCNKRARDLSVAKKVRLREEAREHRRETACRRSIKPSAIA